MYLKKLEIAGFKSFADRTVIEFDTGVTAVVGPNGSGKSNISEAIRWVLGEQSAKNLRGGKMPDVIFAGSVDRKALNRTEVTLVLDNEERFLPLDFSEISITRRLLRTGESDYYINKQSCRLKDIVELFMDSGLGKESFSIISQGKVEAIFNSKPEERRGIFEEAAGVLKYKQRKKETEQKLGETEDNLNRLQDVVYEIEEQLIPLKEQKRVAKEYESLYATLTKVDVGVTSIEIHELKNQWEKSSHDFEEQVKKVEQTEQSIIEFEQTVDVLREKRNTLDTTLELMQQELLETTKFYEQTEGQKKVLVERTKNTKEDLSLINTQLVSNQELRETLLEELDSLESEQTSIDDELLVLEKSKNQYEMDLFELKPVTKEELDNLRTEYLEKMQEQVGISNELKYLEKQYQQELAKNKQLLNRKDELIQRLKINQETVEKVSSQLGNQQTKLVELRGNFSSQKSKNEQLSVDLEKKERQMYDTMGNLQQLKARHKSLDELRSSHAGYFQGVKGVLNARHTLPGIVGAVVELINVPTKYVTSIETALGGGAQNIVVKTEDVARACVNYLKKERLGRATFLPLNVIQARHIPDKVLRNAKEVQGFLGVASECISYSEEIRPAIENMLGLTLIATSLETANLVAQRVNYKYRVVSLEGDVMNPGGSITGGASTKKGQSTLLTQTKELEELRERITKLTTLLKEQEITVRKVKSDIVEGNRILEALREKGEVAREREQDFEKRLEILTSEADQIKRESDLFDNEAGDVTAFIASYNIEKEQLEEKLNALIVQQEKINHQLGQQDELEEEKQSQRETIQESMSTIQSELATFLEKKKNVVERLTEKNQQLQSNEVAHVDLQSQLDNLDSSSETQSVTSEELNQRIADLDKKRVKLVESIDESKRDRQTLHLEISQLDELLTKQNKELQIYLAKRSKVELIKSRTETSMDTLLEYLQEEYHLTYEAAREKYELTVSVEDGKKETARLKKQIGKLGVVNPAAIEHCEQVEERYSFLIEQRDDLLTAKESLLSTMNEMDEVVIKKFSTTFGVIQEKFKLVFPQMFGGGKAELSLTDPSDMLNTGIEISAQPPGKKLQSLSLLSGGERALTAITLLFSILQVRPVPFCILDEVEAALDDANVARFGQYLNRFEKSTQFIVITHRKGTMEAADVLYGVTMQEQGVSKVVSVRLDNIGDNGKVIN